MKTSQIIAIIAAVAVVAAAIVLVMFFTNRTHTNYGPSEEKLLPQQVIHTTYEGGKYDIACGCGPSTEIVYNKDNNVTGVTLGRSGSYTLGDKKYECWQCPNGA